MRIPHWRVAWCLLLPCFVHILPPIHLPPPAPLFAPQGLQLLQAVADVAERQEGEMKPEQQRSHGGQGMAEQPSASLDSLQEHGDRHQAASPARCSSRDAICAVRGIVGCAGGVGGQYEKGEGENLLEVMAGLLGDEVDALQTSDGTAE